MTSVARFAWARLVALALLFCISIAMAEPKVVRLRNEVIATAKGARAKAAGAGAAEQPLSGLFLVQLEGPATADQLTALRAAGVAVIQYVPDDAFVARAHGVKPSEVEALPFVRWTGPFRPEHKIFHRIAKPKADEELAVSILLAADATPQQLGSARKTMSKVQSESAQRSGRIWRGSLKGKDLKTLAESDAVLWIEPAPKMQLFDEPASKIVGGDSGGHATAVQAMGYDGSGVVVSVADSGLDIGELADVHPDLHGRVDALFYYGELTDASDEHSHGTHVAGIVAGNGATGETDDYGALWGLGVAPGVHIIAQRLFDGEGGYHAPATFETMTRDAVQAGADIGSNSWGDDTQGRYDISAMEFDALVRDADWSTPGDQQYILEFSAGNAGPGAQTIGSPAVGKNVIATGASQNDRYDYYIYADGIDAMADFSSRGPAEDGRIKPDIVAPGTWISSLRSRYANDEYAWGDISHYYMFQGGTSQAGPHASGAAAIFVQYYRDNYTNATPSPALVKAALINSAIDMDDEVETGPVPNNDEGWGRIDLTQIIGSDRSYDYVDQSVSLTTGQHYDRHIIVADETLPLFITLAYTDVPAFPAAIPALVNDLDLEVIAPDGRTYRGNQFLQGESLAESAGADNLNNVECVFISEPLAGQYTVRVRARNVPQDARIDSPAVDQDFALVASGSLPFPGTGFVFFDRRAYRAPSVINVKVVDADLHGQPAVNVTVRSTSQPAGVALTLLPSGIPGTFTGSVATVTSATANRLLVAHGDSITTTYLDASEGQTRTATARADLLPPVIFNIGTSNAFGKTVVFWDTDEPALGIVRYGTNSTLGSAVTNNFYSDAQATPLSDLIPGRTYYYVIVSEDEAGNRITNNNGGQLFSFVAANAATVLLVDNFQTDDFDFGPDIPLSVYTDTLNQIGVSYDVWSIVGGRPSPSASDLRPYQIVIWRVSDNVVINNTLSAAEQTAVQQYVQSGGSFFMSSMELLTRVPAGFAAEVLQVANFSIDATASTAYGLPGNVISGGGFEMPLDYSNYEYEFELAPSDISDTMTGTTNAFPFLIDDFGEAVGLASPVPGLDRTGRVVFLSFPLDAVSASAAPPNNRAGLMQRILSFLAPGQQGMGSISLNNNEYTVPSVAILEVGDSDLIGAGQVSVTVTSSSDPEGITLTLSEFGRFGVFRGSFPIVATHGPNPSRELVAAPNDTITATYFDASRNASISVNATIEITPPSISGVVVEPSYVDAAVYWETDEPADALVQYGESPLLGRTAYVPTLKTAHEVFIEALQPNRLYYYKVVSRDNAGNVSVDDNNGQLYTFQTLAPLNAPWSDDLESGDANWFVYAFDDSELNWEYGMPNNGVSAHSGSRVWASNLDGATAGYVESYLISPPIYLTGGNRATLRFWQNYEFFIGENDFIHLGEVAIITNAAAQPVTLDVIEDWASGDWEEAEYDLSPYSGQLVYLVWHYVFFTFDDAPRLGWVIDDISVTVSNAVPGILRITNNLSQAGFSVTGPFSFKGQGTTYVNTNAAPGEYTITYSNVLYYVTPPIQTATVTAGSETVIVGEYTFSDENGNGISDDWEVASFGSVSPGRTQSTDTDQDGMTDQAEFSAGTNPNNAQSRLRIFEGARQSTGLTRYDWSTIPGRSYRVMGSTNLPLWTPLTDWMRAGGSVLSHTLSSTNGLRFLKIEVRP